MGGKYVKLILSPFLNVQNYDFNIYAFAWKSLTIFTLKYGYVDVTRQWRLYNPR